MDRVRGEKKVSNKKNLKDILQTTEALSDPQELITMALQWQTVYKLSLSGDMVLGSDQLHALMCLFTKVLHDTILLRETIGLDNMYDDDELEKQYQEMLSKIQVVMVEMESKQKDLVSTEFFGQKKNGKVD